MTNDTIPPWTALGVLPPIGLNNPIGTARSPYRVSLLEMVEHFDSSPERHQILDGLLKYRSALHGIGLVEGFQWFDGSFLEQIEVIESRAPKDIDVVTFYKLPAGTTAAEVVQRAPDLFPAGRADQQLLKQRYLADAYYVNLEAAAGELVRHSTYWYSLWSHRRDQIWKGYLEVDLSPTDDTQAAAMLATLTTSGVQP